MKSAHDHTGASSTRTVEAVKNYQKKNKTKKTEGKVNVRNYGRKTDSFQNSFRQSQNSNDNPSI
jgi:hypothetical protein